MHSLLTTLVAWLVVIVKRGFNIYGRLFRKFDKESKNHGGQLVADVLKSHGVEFIFTLCGGHISPILVASEEREIRVVDVRHEADAVFAADAVARLSGVIGVAAVTAGPGLTNTVTAVKNAQMAESPVLVIGGAAATMLKGRGALQDIDQISLFKPICKFCATVKYVRDVVPTLKKAIHIAQSGTPGPVFVEFPIDTLYPYHIVEKELLSGSKDPQTLFQKISNIYVECYMYDLYGDAWEEHDPAPISVQHNFVSDNDVSSVVKLVMKSKKPCILLGSQATLPPTPADDVRAALEQLGIPTFLAGMSRGLLGRNGPCHIRQKRKDALKEADLIVLAGVVCDFRLGYGRILNRKAKIVSVNRSKDQLYKNTDVMWKPSLAFQGDPAAFLVSLSDACSKEQFVCDSEWMKVLKNRDEEKDIANKEKAKVAPKVHLNPLMVLYQLEEVMDDNSILVVDGGDFVGTAAYTVRPRRPLGWLDPGAFGTLGVGGGFALGAKLCRPDADVWIIYGDGSLGYSVAEFDTFARHNTPVLALVGNDACWSQIAREQVPMFNSSVACDLSYCEYEKVAEGYGGIGFRMDAETTPTARYIRGVLEKAKEVSRNRGKPVLINALIGKSDFRAGSISV